MNIEQIIELTRNHTLRWSTPTISPPHVVYDADLDLPDKRILVIEYCKFRDPDDLGGMTTYKLNGSISGVPIFSIPTDAAFGGLIRAAALAYVDAFLETMAASPPTVVDSPA